jgi:hypothetical protein
MVDYADAALVFWDGASKGTSDLVRKLIKAKKPILLIPFKPTP